MAHFAQLDENDTVIQVIVVSNEDILDANGVESEEVGIAFCKKLLGQNTRWAQTSYNNNKRTRYAGPGYQLNRGLDSFLTAKPFESWELDTVKKDWKAPVAKPVIDESKQALRWDEKTRNWKVEARKDDAGNDIKPIKGA